MLWYHLILSYYVWLRGYNWCKGILLCTNLLRQWVLLIPRIQDFLKATFPLEFPGVCPSYIFYDDNCHLWKHLVASGDTYFVKVGLPVDVFHFKSKHRETDTFCQTHCNPARFRELIGPNDTWIFNSSAAEQTNAWFGLFQPIVREMPEPK